MKNLIKKILKKENTKPEVYNLFEEEEFDPFGHITDQGEDDLELSEMGVDMEKDCVLGFSKNNAKLEWPYFSLPAGYTCPFATVCKNFPAKWEGSLKGGKFKKPSSWEKNVKAGPKAEMMCYAARAQGQYPGANVQAFKNLDLVKKMKTKEKIADLIVKSMKYHNIDNTDVLRIHEAGDFFSQEYFDAWVEVAKRLPNTLFYAYTVSLPYYMARKNSLPNNFKVIASMDKNNEDFILDNDLRYSRVVNSTEEAKELGLPIDVDDSLAWGTDDNFALIIHGGQPKGSEAAKALKKNRESGLYDKMKKIKKMNQTRKNALRDKIRKELRSESFINEGEWDWAESIPNPLEISDVPQKIWVLDLTREEQKKIYDYLVSLGFESNIAIEAIIKHEGYGQKLAILILNVDSRVYFGDEEVDDLLRGKEKPRPKGKLGHLSFYEGGKESQQKQHLEQLKDSWKNSYGSYLEIDPKDLLDLIDNNLSEDLEYWGVKGDKMGPLKEDDFSWAEGDSLDDVVFKTKERPELTYIIKDNANPNDNIIRVYKQGGGFVNTITRNYVKRKFKSGEWYAIDDKPINEEESDFGSENDEVTSLKGHRGYEDWVFIHRNLNRPPYYSIKAGKSGGPVIGYDTDIHLKDVQFKVQKGGMNRVRKEKRKNVHAGVVGKIIDSGGEYNTDGWVLITYNPYKHNSFVEYETEKPIFKADEVILKNEREVWAKK